MRKTLILAAAAAVVLGAPALAFHDGGVAHCNGCHTMHNSQDGVGMNDGLPVGEGFASLLLFADATSVCLDCHDGEGSYHIWSADPDNPDVGNANRGGGDFVFLEETNINDAHGGASNPIMGYAAGHSVISTMKGTIEDPVLSSSPGGAYPASEMACTSCHDPHGTGSYRILYQSGQAIPFATFTATIDADGISLFGPSESNTNHNAYKTGFSAWCATCHEDFHAKWGTEFIHPSGQNLGAGVALQYNTYMGSTDCVDNPPAGVTPCGSGTGTGVYLAAVPFEDDAMTTSFADGPTSASRVACMTCHRAHATSAPDAGRWDFSITGLEEDGHESTSYKIPNPYPGDTSQRSACNKCHGQDEFDEILDFTP
jgi:predicted CXXCH cytochrome family protein